MLKLVVSKVTTGLYGLIANAVWSRLNRTQNSTTVCLNLFFCAVNPVQSLTNFGDAIAESIMNSAAKTGLH